MVRNGKMRIKYAVIFVMLFGLLVLSCQQRKEVKILWDTWGVPHIYSASEEALAYGFGYAQAKDRLEQILSSYRYAEGSMSEAFGPEYIDLDYVQRVWRHAEISKEKYQQMPVRFRKILQAFIGGIKQYMQEHPDQVPEWAPDIQPWHPVALGRAFIWWWPLDQALDDLKSGKRKKEHTHGSNQWSVSGSRTESGAPILLIDPHLSWNKDGHWFEARLHGGKLHVSGICVVGTPFIGLGHNRHLAWAATTGGPDCGDVYEEEINPDNPLQYKYEGEWRDISVDTLHIPVKTDEGVVTVERVVERTHHGPIQERDGLKAYAIALPYAEEIGLVEQLYYMNTAKNLDEFKEALELRQFMPQNIMVADQEGNIYYQRTGRVPIRNQKYDWSKPVPGNTKETEWQGIHPTKDLVQILNPETGFMQNCNISPATMFPGSPLVSAKYPAYIYNDLDNRDNPRGRQAVALLSAETRMSFDRAQEIATDTGIYGVQPWLDALKEAYAKYKRQYRDVEQAVNLIVQWDGHVNKESQGATLYRFWRQELNKINPGISDARLSTLSPKQRRAMLRAVRKAKGTLKSYFGSYKVAWGKTVILERGNKTFALDGGTFENDISSLRAIWGKTEKGLTKATGGQSGPMVVSLTKKIKSVSVLPWGESDNPDSPHFGDQAEKLFSQKKFKPTWFEMDELKGHIESEKIIVLTGKK